MTYMIQRQKNTARANAQNVQVSTKQCIEICNFLRGKNLDKAIAILERVAEKEQAIPFRRFTDGVGHRRGKIGAGRYPVKAATEIQVLLENVKANATSQGLTGDLKVTHIAANKASRPMRNRLKYRGEFKRTHVEVVVTEVPGTRKAPAKKPKTEAAAPKATEKPEKDETKATEKPKEKPETPTAKKPEKTEKKVEKKSETKETPKEPPVKQAPKSEKKPETPQEKTPEVKDGD